MFQNILVGIHYKYNRKLRKPVSVFRNIYPHYQWVALLTDQNILETYDIHSPSVVSRHCLTIKYQNEQHELVSSHPFICHEITPVNRRPKRNFQSQDDILTCTWLYVIQLCQGCCESQPQYLCSHPQSTLSVLELAQLTAKQRKFYAYFTILFPLSDFHQIPEPFSLLGTHFKNWQKPIRK